MPDVTQKEVGRRLYHVHREKMAEGAIKKIKIGLGDEWKSFTKDEIHSLGLLLQCTWNVIDRKEWDKIPFGHLTKNDVRNILTIGREYVPGATTDRPVIDEIKKILLALI
ncbi:MAG: hypothetical protein A4E35_01773 [Methanoregula sp. PtaU1.Bin051]|nr:MAG: hypothetical protein A4E35_01773 [Methanoregula sp. PtaU1.Bin051]